MSRPTAERLREIRAAVARAERLLDIPYVGWASARAIVDLLAEIDALAEQLAASERARAALQEAIKPDDLKYAAKVVRATGNYGVAERLESLARAALGAPKRDTK